MACLGDPESDKMAEERAAFWRVFEAIMQACAAEFLGTTIYVLIACLVSSGVKGIGILPPEHMPMIVPIALCAGFTVAALMATFGKMRYVINMFCKIKLLILIKLKKHWG